MKRVLLPAACLLAIFVLAVCLWWFRPWSEFSPAEVYAFSRAQDRTQAYRMMEEIYPSAEIAAAPAPTAFPRAPSEIESGYNLNGEAQTLDDYAARRVMTGLIVVQGGEVVLERYYRGEGPEDRHTSWSVAKSVVATLVGHALMEGEIESLDDRADQYAAEYGGTDFGRVSIRNLLAMSSGIDFDEDYETDGSDIRRLFFGTFFRNRDVDSLVRQHEANRPAGDDFHYISANTAVLAAVLRGAYDGTDLPRLAEEKLFTPLGLHGGTWLTDRPGGKALGYCCLQLRLEDFARLGQLYLDGGAVGADRLVPEGWPAFVSTPPDAAHEPRAGRPGYGHHFWVLGEGVYAMQGYNGQIVWIDPARDVVIAMTSADPAWPGGEAEYVPLFDQLAARAAAR